MTSFLTGSSAPPAQKRAGAALRAVLAHPQLVFREHERALTSFLRGPPAAPMSTALVSAPHRRRSRDR